MKNLSSSETTTEDDYDEDCAKLAAKWPLH